MRRSGPWRWRGVRSLHHQTQSPHALNLNGSALSGNGKKPFAMRHGQVEADLFVHASGIYSAHPTLQTRLVRTSPKGSPHELTEAQMDAVHRPNSFFRFLTMPQKCPKVCFCQKTFEGSGRRLRAVASVLQPWGAEGRGLGRQRSISSKALAVRLASWDARGAHRPAAAQHSTTQHVAAPDLAMHRWRGRKKQSGWFGLRRTREGRCGK